ncbi:MAG: DUF962 domain-containing protein [Gammaproteobacteria bacterium]|nr:DUF962 domain-containing protein [Gammaproteobacteria bacterium]
MTGKRDSKLMSMLAGYAAAHQHPFNVTVHLIGIPIIMLGVTIPLTWVDIAINGFSFTAAHVVVLGFFLFYLTLDWIFATVFLLFGLLVVQLAADIGALPFKWSASIAAAAFFGGYIAQFVGHAVEKSMPVLLKHPIQANLAAPFFTIVEIFHILGLRKELFNEVRARIEELRRDQSTA